ncbi:MAG: TadE family protein [Candidatus Limnocylindrales bacterium]
MPSVRRRVAGHVRSHSRGQSLVEFAVVLPILAVLLGACLDLARAYETAVKLESATRDAAEYAAMNATSTTEAAQQAGTVVCVQFSQTVPCTNPSVSASFSSSTTSGGGTVSNPALTVTVTTSTTFTTLFPYPFVSAGGISMSASSTYKILQGR